eukprot:7029982-Prymnesium_polylepis.1
MAYVRGRADDTGRVPCATTVFSAYVPCRRPGAQRMCATSGRRRTHAPNRPSEQRAPARHQCKGMLCALQRPAPARLVGPQAHAGPAQCAMHAR